EVGQHAVGAGAPAAHGLGIPAVEGGGVGLRARAGAPKARPFGDAAVPVDEPPRGQLAHEHVAEHGDDVAADHALDHLGGLGSPALVVVEVVGERARDGVGPLVARRPARSEPLRIRPPRARRALRLREIEDVLAVGVLQIVGAAELLLVIDAVVVAPARDPAAAGRASAVAEMQALLEQAAVRLAARFETQACAAGAQVGVADGARHGVFACLFCLFFAYYPFPERTGCRRTP